MLENFSIFDLINSLSGGNSSWSIFDLANRTFISFGAISHNLYSFPVAIIYFIFHKLFPNIPERIYPKTPKDPVLVFS